MNCPKCQSPNIVSAKLISDLHMNHAETAARMAQQLGNKRLSILASLGAIGAKGVNALCNDYRCTDCGYKFDDGASGAEIV